MILRDMDQKIREKKIKLTCITKKIMVVMVMVMMLVIMVAMVATEGILTMKSEAAMLTIVTMTKL